MFVSLRFPFPYSQACPPHCVKQELIQEQSIHGLIFEQRNTLCKMVSTASGIGSTTVSITMRCLECLSTITSESFEARIINQL